MAANLPVRLRVLVPAVENAIAGNAFRPGDILPSRKGITVEIGNTDAEGRLILGDALAIPALNAICSQAAPRNEQGLVQGTLGAVNSLAVIIGPFSASMVLGFVTAPGAVLPLPGAWFLLSAAFFLAGALIVRRKTPNLHKTVT